MQKCRDIFYTLFFFLLGFFWLWGGGVEWFICFFLIGFYVFDYFILKRCRVVSREFLVFLFVFLIFSIHLFWANIYELARFGYVPFHEIYRMGGVVKLMGFALKSVSLFVAFQCFKQTTSKSVLFEAFTWGAVSFLFCLFLGWSSFLSSEWTGRLSLVFGEGRRALSPNAIAYAMMVCIYINIIAFLRSRHTVNRVVYLAYCVVAFVVILLTGSRTSLASLLIGLFFWFCLKKKRFLYFSFAVFALCLCFFVLNVDFFSYLPRRFSVAQALEDRASGRAEIWKDYLEHATLKDRLLGIGYIAGTEAILYQKPLREMVPLVLLKLKANPAPIKILISHNTFLYHFLTFGIAGLLCYCIFLWRIFVLIWRQFFSEKESGVFLALLVSFLAFSCFEADFLGKNFCMIFAVLLAQVFQKDGNDACEARGLLIGIDGKFNQA